VSGSCVATSGRQASGDRPTRPAAPTVSSPSSPDMFVAVARTRQAENKREPILQATWALIAEHGLRGLRIENVAAQVGVASSLVYYHFGSRAGLLAATMDYVDALSPSSDIIVSGSSESAYSRLERALLAELGGSARVRANAVVWNEFSAAAAFDPVLRERVCATSRRWASAVADWIREGQRDGSVRSDVDPREQAALLTALLEGLNSRSLTGFIDRAEARKLLAKALREGLAVA